MKCIEIQRIDDFLYEIVTGKSHRQVQIIVTGVPGVTANRGTAELQNCQIAKAQFGSFNHVAAWAPRGPLNTLTLFLQIMMPFLIRPRVSSFVWPSVDAEKYGYIGHVTAADHCIYWRTVSGTICSSGLP